MIIAIVASALGGLILLLVVANLAKARAADGGAVEQKPSADSA